MANDDNGTNIKAKIYKSMVGFQRRCMMMTLLQNVDLDEIFKFLFFKFFFFSLNVPFLKEF